MKGKPIALYVKDKVLLKQIDRRVKRDKDRLKSRSTFTELSWLFTLNYWTLFQTFLFQIKRNGKKNS